MWYQLVCNLPMCLLTTRVHSYSLVHSCAVLPHIKGVRRAPRRVGACVPRCTQYTRVREEKKRREGMGSDGKQWEAMAMAAWQQHRVPYYTVHSVCVCACVCVVCDSTPAAVTHTNKDHALLPLPLPLPLSLLSPLSSGMYPLGPSSTSKTTSTKAPGRWTWTRWRSTCGT